MGSGECVARVDKLENGYTVEVYDEKIRASNKKPKTEWQDPWKTYAFSTAAEVMAYLTAHLDSLKPPPDADEEFGDAFKQATAEDD